MIISYIFIDLHDKVLVVFVDIGEYALHAEE